MPATFTQRCVYGGSIESGLAQAGGYITKAINDRMGEAMLQVQQEAISRAPVKTGALRQSIKLESGDSRRSWRIYIDGAVQIDPMSRPVGDYALWMHEGIPDYALGPVSLASVVEGDGRKFLEIPFERIINQQLIAELQAMLRSPARNALGRFA